MKKGRTAPEVEFPGWYVEFQTNVLRQLPRPGNKPDQIDKVTAEKLGKDSATMKVLFVKALLPERQPISVPGTIIPKTPKVLRPNRDFYFDIFADLARANEAAFSFANVPIPNDPGGYTWPICVPAHSVLGDEVALFGGKRQYKITYRYANNMDAAIDHTFGRDAWDKPYIVRVRPNDEADKDMKNMSAEDILAQSINTLTFRERALLQRFLLWKENRILDKNVITLCSGSRYSDGHVPVLYWYDDGVFVYWFLLDKALDYLRACRAVSV